MDVRRRSDERKDLLEFLPVDMRERLLQCLSANERADPTRRAELLAGLNQKTIEQIASDIAQQVDITGEAIPLITILYEGNLQAISMILGLVLNREVNSFFWGIGTDCNDDTKAAVITELSFLLKALWKSMIPGDKAIMVEIARETATFVDNIDKEKMNERLASAVAELTKETPTKKIGIIG